MTLPVRKRRRMLAFAIANRVASSTPAKVAVLPMALATLRSRDDVTTA
jgi:hypothetical protein